MYSSNVLQLESTIASVVGLFGEGCLRVWDLVSGDLARRIVLVRSICTYILCMLCLGRVQQSSYLDKMIFAIAC